MNSERQGHKNALFCYVGLRLFGSVLWTLRGDYVCS